MKITAEELKAIYRNMPDEELLSLDRGDLTEVALQVHAQELERRGLHLDAEVEQLAQEEPVASVESFESLEQAQMAESMLESAGVPAHLENDTMRGRGFRVMVAASLLEDARHVLTAAPAVADADAIIISARFENGAFIPLEELDIREGAVVEVHITPSDVM
jgi:Protein of unknown function DUF104/Putative prokaryotic signal transducing protein